MWKISLIVTVLAAVPAQAFKNTWVRNLRMCSQLHTTANDPLNKYYELMHPKIRFQHNWQTKEVDELARKFFPEKFRLETIDRRIMNLLNAGHEITKNDLDEFRRTQQHKEWLFSYEFEGRNFECGLKGVVHRSCKDNSVQLNYILNANDVSFMYGDPADVAPVMRSRDVYPRDWIPFDHKASRSFGGWVQFEDSAFQQVPHFDLLCKTLLTGALKSRKMFYNRDHEMLEMEQMDMHGTAIALQFERQSEFDWIVNDDWVDIGGVSSSSLPDDDDVVADVDLWED